MRSRSEYSSRICATVRRVALVNHRRDPLRCPLGIYARVLAAAMPRRSRLPRSPVAPVPWGVSSAAYRVSRLPCLARPTLAVPLRRIDGRILPTAARACQITYGLLPLLEADRCATGRMLAYDGRDARPMRQGFGFLSHRAASVFVIGLLARNGGVGVASRASVSPDAGRWTRGRREPWHSRPWCCLVRNYYVYLVRYVATIAPLSAADRSYSKRASGANNHYVYFWLDSARVYRIPVCARVILSSRARLVWRDRARLY